MAGAFTVEPGAQGFRVVNPFGRTVTSGVTTFAAAQEMAELLSSGSRFRGRGVVLDGVRRSARRDSGEVRTANGKTCNRPIKGVKQVVTESSRPRGY